MGENEYDSRSDEQEQPGSDEEEEEEEEDDELVYDDLDVLSPGSKQKQQALQNKNLRHARSAKLDKASLDPKLKQMVRKPSTAIRKPSTDLHVHLGQPLQRQASKRSRDGSTGSRESTPSGRRRRRSRDYDDDDDSEDDKPEVQTYKRSHFATSRLPFNQRKKWDTLSDVIKLDYIRKGPSPQGQEAEESLAAELMFRYQCVFPNSHPYQLTPDQNRWVLSMGTRCN
jgi:hypothetical protein